MKLPIVLTGEVIHGNHIGTGMGMPTANIIPGEDVSGLPRGVYYSTLETEGRVYRAITNLGAKPTIKDDEEINAESFILDFEGDLYGKNIILTLLEFRRPERKFDSLKELAGEVQKDIEAGKHYGI